MNLPISRTRAPKLPVFHPKHAHIRPVVSITFSLYLHAYSTTPFSAQPASRDALNPLAETVNRASVHPSPYDRIPRPMQLATSFLPLLRALLRANFAQNTPYSPQTTLPSPITHKQPLSYQNTSITRASRPFHHLFPHLSALQPFPIRPAAPRFPRSLPASLGLLLLESPFVSYPYRSLPTPFPSGVPKDAFYLDPVRRLERTKGGFRVLVCIMPEPPFVDQVVRKGVKVEMQAAYRPAALALAFVPLHTTSTVTRGVQNTFPSCLLLSLKGGAL